MSSKQKQSVKKPVQKSGDQIKVSNRGKSSVIAAGRYAWAWLFNINIHDLKWQPVVISMTVVGSLLGVILWFVVPKSSSIMTSQFNVAVAEFLVQDLNGKTIKSDDGWRLADYVAKQIAIQFDGIELNKTVPYEIWGPDKVGPIKGKTADERKTNAAEVSKEIQAQVLIYGIIIADGEKSKFAPEFYINHKGFWQASEIGGPHEMGNQLNVTLPFGTSIQAVENPALAGRVNALDLIVIGLAYSSVDDYQNAVNYFEKAIAESRWLEGSGKKVGYILVGNAYVGWASKDNNSQYLSLAEENYAKSLDENENYGRGLVGKANVLYLASLGSLQDIKIDPAKLDEAVVLTERALLVSNLPENIEANISAKAHFNLGQISWARFRANLPGEDWAEKAKQEFTLVIQDYESNNTAIETYAAHAYLRLGLIEYAQNKTNLSVDISIALVQKAISLAPPFYKGEYTITLGNIYKNAGQEELAEQAYKNALTIAEANGDAKSFEKYKKILDELDQP